MNSPRTAIDDLFQMDEQQLLEGVAAVLDLADVRLVRTLSAHCNRAGQHHNLRIHILDAGMATVNRFRVVVESDRGVRLQSSDADSVAAALDAMRWTGLDA